MINRTLIRVKVIQILYSHLISRNEFHIFTEPPRKTKESEQSFTVYYNLLALLLCVTGQKGMPSEITGKSGNHILREDKMLAILSDSHDLKDFLRQNLSLLSSDFPSFAENAVEDISKSVAYKDLIKKRSLTIEENILFWNTILKTTVRNLALSFFKERYDFSSGAVDKGIELLSDTLKGYTDIRVTYNDARKALDNSFAESYRLYMGLLYLAVELTREREIQLEAAKNKYLPTHEELNPDTKFIDNRFVKALRDDERVKEYIDKHHIDWDTETGLLKSLLSDILNSPAYKEYMESKESSFAEDCELWKKLFREVIFQSDALNEALESKSIYWNDDLYIIGTFVVKTIRLSSKSDDGKETIDVFPMYKDEEDREFGIELFKDTAEHQEEYRRYIDRFIKADWDIERIAFMDIVIMTTAISELINFPNIPMPVTMNEYTEIASDYSGGNSPKFVNGLLFSVAQELKKEGRIHK